MPKVFIQICCSMCDDERLDCGEIEIADANLPNNIAKLVMKARNEDGWREEDNKYFCSECVHQKIEVVLDWISRLKEMVEKIKNDPKLSDLMKAALTEGPIEQISELEAKLN